MIFNGYTFKLLHEDEKKEISIEAKDADDLFKQLLNKGCIYLGTGDFLEMVFMKEKYGALPDVILIEKDRS